jgi:phosphoenolpyruvate carboxykinase (GTP)
MGFFGVVPGTNSKTNPNAVNTISHDTIYTNVALKPDGALWWEGHDDPAPAEAIDWRGQPWRPGATGPDGKINLSSHPNSRFTAPFTNCPTHSFRYDEHHGVPISAIIFGGRRPTLSPLVHEALSWDHGVYLGATLASERTAAQIGVVGEIRRDPMAMLPFCGYNMADYFGHWLDMGTRLTRPPKIFSVNWFRTDEDGRFLWPGFGENLRIIEWILARCRDEVPGIPTPIGYVPDPRDIDMTGLDVADSAMRKLLAINSEAWDAELNAISEFFEQFGPRMPDALWAQHEALRQRLSAASPKPLIAPVRES